MTTTVHGPTAPTSAASARLDPLDLTDVTLADGHLGRWQARSGRETLPHCIEQLEVTGALESLRAAAVGRRTEPFGLLWFSDSDVHKTLEAALWESAHNDDETIATYIDTATALLRSAQEPDGYLNSWFQLRTGDDRWANLKWGHELYCVGHLVQAAVAATRVGGNAELLPVARAAADLVVTRYGPGGEDGICGHPEIETALVELYRATGHRPYLDTAAKMIESRGRGLVATGNRPIGVGDERFAASYFQDGEPVRTATAATGHAVRQLYLDAGVVDVAVETGDQALLAASETRWDDLFATKTYVTGAHGSRHRDEAIGDAYELPSDRAYAETCAAIASFHWNWRLLLATGRHRYAEEMERVLFNAIAGASAEDGRHFFYSNPLHLRSGHDGSDEDAPSTRLSWYLCPCCPPNLARLYATLHGYALTTDADGVQVHLLGALTATAAVPGGRARLRIDSDYPSHGTIALTVEDTPTGSSWTLSVRVPEWAADVAVELNGRPIEVSISDGYLRVQRDWQVTDTVTVSLPLAPRLLVAHPRVDAVRDCVAVARGPVVYCLEQADLPEHVALEDVRVDVASLREVPGGEAADAPPVLRIDASVSGAAGVSALYRTFTPAASAEPARTPLTDEDSTVELSLVPYATWGNRTSTAMRVWLPVVPRRRPLPGARE